MYYREFPTMFDWVHNGEGLTTFNLHGLMDPTERNFEKRVRRFSEMYMGADPAMGPGSQNYDPQHKVIRSLLNGSRGPMLLIMHHRRRRTGVNKKKNHELAFANSGVCSRTQWAQIDATDA